jgi:hypothetical protein
MALTRCAVCNTERDEASMITENNKDFCNQNCFSVYNSAKSFRASSSTVTLVASRDTNGVILATNLMRKMATVYNNSTSVLFIKYGAEAALNSFTLKIGAGDYLELPYPCYTGQIDGFWEAINGNAMVTEIE